MFGVVVVEVVARGVYRSVECREDRTVTGEDARGELGLLLVEELTEFLRKVRNQADKCYQRPYMRLTLRWTCKRVETDSKACKCVM